MCSSLIFLFCPKLWLWPLPGCQFEWNIVSNTFKFLVIIFQLNRQRSHYGRLSCTAAVTLWEVKLQQLQNIKGNLPIQIDKRLVDIRLDGNLFRIFCKLIQFSYFPKRYLFASSSVRYSAFSSVKTFKKSNINMVMSNRWKRKLLHATEEIDAKIQSLNGLISEMVG